jgi:tRNA pseudouridine38-40 synthase
MGKKLEEIAESKEDLEGFRSRQAEVADFWDTVDYASIAPLTKGFDDKIQKAVLQTLRDSGVLPTQYAREADLELSKDTEWSKAEAATIENSIRQVKAAHLKAKKEYRLDPRRLARVREGLGLYLGTKNFYNYTVNKTSKDPSARRLIKTFIAEDPIIIGGTEWLSLKIHGQSFMMHQIRKMISMVALVVRTGCPLSRITDSLTAPMSIPKLPGLGLLLERPVFDTYNQRAVEQFHKETLDFDKYTSAIMEFKQREIYDRIFREEEETNTFHQWFGHIDSFRTDWYLYLSSAGTEASPKKTATGWLGHEHNQKAVDRPPNLESDDEDEAERAQGADIGG